MNAVLQCLMHCSPLVEYFTQNIHKRDALSPSHLKIGSSLATTFAVTCHEVYSRPSRTSVNPSQLKESIAELAPQFEGIEQHDAHEFLRFFLDGLSEELKVEKRGELDQNNIEGLEPKEQSQFWWSKHVQANSSIVSDLFCGQLRSTLICNTCQHQSYCFDPFYDLSLPLPKSISHVRNFATSLKNKMVHASKKEKIMKKGCVLDDCLQALLEDELLSCTNTVICERCKERRECKKTLRIEKFPQVLVLHLKRFDNSRRKKNMPISIPLTGLNLAPFAAEKLYQLGSRNALYDLFGRIDHSGSASRGHYVA
jgi:ubiquitin carboxyl-terminal hydrolase 2/21